MKMISPDPHEIHPIEVVIRMTGCSRRKIVFYCRKGIVSPVCRDGDGMCFDEDSVIRIRHIETLRQQHRMNWAAIHTIIGLLDELEALRAELRWRR
ncbi:MerR family transcriptional regulator [Akkermansiaceae bacterium]|nr:MerR family transcriptional regulator [Akkermansiaceae bacterium]